MTKTPAQVKAEFLARGIPVSKWADDNGFPRDYVYRVLNGYSACKRGIAHDIAVKLGIKPQPRQEQAQSFR